jgi:hypothetical protein
MQSCSKCGLEKELTSFYKNKKNKNGLSKKCKGCDDVRLKLWNKNNPEKKRVYNKIAAKIYRDKHKHKATWKYNKRIRDIKRIFGISDEELKNLTEKQNNRCAICNKVFIKTPHIDHIMRYNKVIVRGLLCSNCNTAIGLLEENYVLILNAAKYVQENES